MPWGPEEETPCGVCIRVKRCCVQGDREVRDRPSEQAALTWEESRHQDELGFSLGLGCGDEKVVRWSLEGT